MHASHEQRKAHQLNNTGLKFHSEQFHLADIQFQFPSLDVRSFDILVHLFTNNEREMQRILIEIIYCDESLIRIGTCRTHTHSRIWFLFFHMHGVHGMHTPTKDASIGKTLIFSQIELTSLLLCVKIETIKMKNTHSGAYLTALYSLTFDLALFDV